MRGSFIQPRHTVPKQELRYRATRKLINVLASDKKLTVNLSDSRWLSRQSGAMTGWAARFNFESPHNAVEWFLPTRSSSKPGSRA
jgi:hypothetical protein